MQICRLMMQKLQSGRQKAWIRLLMASRGPARHLLENMEKIFFRNVAMTEEVLAIVLAILRRYVVCNRCQKVKSVSFISTRAALR